jgi:hypothetical protein
VIQIFNTLPVNTCRRRRTRSTLCPKHINNELNGDTHRVVRSTCPWSNIDQNINEFGKKLNRMSDATIGGKNDTAPPHVVLR